MKGFFVNKTKKDDVILNMNAMNYVRMRYMANDLIFLVDTGASVSIIFSKVLQSDEYINTNKQVVINGIAGSTKSIGSVNLSLNPVIDYEISHEFLVLKDFVCRMDGIIGTDFLIKHSANINFQKFLLSFDTITIPLESDYYNFITIPPRCEIIKYCWVDDTDECVIPSIEICEGVFIAGAIAKPKSHMIPVRFLNTNDNEIKIRNFRPTTSNLSSYDLFSFDHHQISVERVDNLLDLINTKNFNEKQKINSENLREIC